MISSKSSKRSINKSSFVFLKKEKKRNETKGITMQGNSLLQLEVEIKIYILYMLDLQAMKMIVLGILLRGL